MVDEPAHICGRLEHPVDALLRHTIARAPLLLDKVFFDQVADVLADGLTRHADGLRDLPLAHCRLPVRYLDENAEPRRGAFVLEDVDHTRVSGFLPLKDRRLANV